MMYCIIVITILLWFITFVNCDKVCDVQKDEKKCCIHYIYVNGTCIECPKGWFGEECNQPCSNGFYGVGCKGTCRCTDDQICDVQDGCVHKKTAECQKGFFGEECKLPCPDGFYGVSCKETCICTTDQTCDVQEGCVNNNTNKCPRGPYGGECQLVCPIGRYGVTCNETCNCTSDQICNAEKGCVYNTDNTFTIIETTSTEQQTTKSNEYHKGILQNHLYGITLGGVVIVLVILLVHTHRKWKSIDHESELRHDQQTEEARSEVVELNKNTEESFYEEICEFDTEYSHTHTFSSEDTSFSRSRGKEVNQVQQMKHTILHRDAIAR